jgi:uncharacterized membrane protein
MDIIIALLKGIKGISEKHIIPSAVSFICMIFTYFLAKSNNPFLVKVGKTFFLWFFFLLYLVLIELGIFIYNKIKDTHMRKKEKEKQDKELAEKQKREIEAKRQLDEMAEKKLLQELWRFVDDLDITDFGYLKKFIQTNNEPIKVKEDYKHNSILFQSALVHKSIIKEAKQIPIQINRSRSANDFNYIPLERYDIEPAIIGYILTEDTYNLLKLSQSKYGKISNIKK